MDTQTMPTGKKIKQLREQSGFTQSNIANFLEVDQSLISKIEKDERSLTSSMLEKLATLFGVTVENLLNEKEPAKRITFAFRANEISASDLETISAVNRIALNLNFMAKLLEGRKID